MSAATVKNQLLLALDEGTSEKVLYELWNVSRSVKVRKAIAGNPNASPDVLRSAARLYLEEVLANPGFSMLELFDDDPWISKVSLAYNEPRDFLMKYGSKMYYGRAGSFDHAGWAALLSPKLTALILEKVVGFMTSAALKRALKNPQVMRKMETLYQEALESRDTWPFSMEILLILKKEGVITREQLFQGLSNYGMGSVSSRKAVYVRYISSLHSDYSESNDLAEREFIARLLAKSYIVSRSHTMNWVCSSMTNSQIPEWGGELYSRVLMHMSNKSKSYLISDNVRMVGTVVVQYLKNKFLSGPYKSKNFEDIYNFVKSNSIENFKFSRFGLMVSSKDSLDELSKCPVEVKTFFCKTGSLGSWAGATGNDPKYQIINEVNEAIYAGEGVRDCNLLFNQCSMRKVISLDDSTHIF
jgi:hypothetical protein